MKKSAQGSPLHLLWQRIDIRSGDFAIEAGIARGALSETINFVRTRSRPWKDAGVEHAAQDPYTIAQIGEMKIRVSASDVLLQRAMQAARNPARFRAARPMRSSKT